jgi:Na+-driven multidrug efflux pump
LVLLFALLSTSIIFLIVNNLPGTILSFYITSDIKMHDLAIRALSSYTYVYFIDSLQCLLLGIMKGMGIHHYVFVHSIVCMWVVGFGSAMLIAFTGE